MYCFLILVTVSTRGKLEIGAWPGPKDGGMGGDKLSQCTVCYSKRYSYIHCASVHGCTESFGLSLLYIEDPKKDSRFHWTKINLGEFLAYVFGSTLYGHRVKAAKSK